MPTLTTPTTVTFPIQIDQVLTLTNNFGAGRVTLSAQRGGDVVFDYTNDQLLNAPVFSSGSQGIVTITHLSGSLTYNVTPSAFPLFENTPRVLFQSAIPFILAGGTATNQFTISATGALSNLPTLPITSGNAFIYLPAITGLTAGWYYSNILSATTAQISTSRYTSGDPALAIPATFTNPSGITAGNYSQTTATDIQCQTFVLPGGAMGPNGSVRAYLAVSMAANANTKTFRFRFGTTSMTGGSGNWGSGPCAGLGCVVQNINAQNSNKCMNGSSSLQPYSIGGSGGVSLTSINTAADVTANFTINIGTASDFAISEYCNCEVLYGA